MTSRSSPKIAFFGKSKSRTLYTTFVMRGLERQACRVWHINPNTLRRWLGPKLANLWICRALRRYQPDAVVIFSGDIQMNTLDYLVESQLTPRIAFLLDDYFSVDAPVTDKIRKGDFFFHTTPSQLEEYRMAGVKRPVYVHSGVDPDIHYKGRPKAEYMSDVAFVGGAVYEHRIDLIRTLSEQVDLKLYGPGWWDKGLPSVTERLEVPGFRRLCRSAKIILGVDKTHERELYFSNRTWFVLGCGGFLLTRYVPGLEKIFANHKHLVWFHSDKEAVEQIRFYLGHPGTCDAIARAGHEFAHGFYPFDRMARNMIDVMFHDREPLPLTDPGKSFASGSEALVCIEEPQPREALH